jgi:hypothetical protein
MKDFYAIIYKAFIITSIVSFIISLFSSGTVSIGSSITGYSLLILGIMMILINSFQKILTIPENTTLLKILYEVFMTTGPLLLLLLIIGFMLYLIINYKSIIETGHVSSGYNSFSTLIIILMLLQTYIIYLSIDNGKINKVTTGLMYLLSILTSICALIVFTILKYFTTDGFINK